MDATPPRSIKCFLVTATPSYRFSLRRFSSSNVNVLGMGPCPITGNWHNIVLPVSVLSEPQGMFKRLASRVIVPENPEFELYDWPQQCVCGHDFLPDDGYMLVYERLYSNPADIGKLWVRQELPPGAMYYADWLSGRVGYCGPDGRCVVVVTPAGEWTIDARARNCTMPEDTIHRCWVRHGEPPNLTVDKNGATCSAGGGSIEINRDGKYYHAFLRNGHLESC